MFKTPPFGLKQKQLQLINLCVGGHDLLCCCSNPLFHTGKIILQQLSKEISEQDKNQLIQCLGDTTTAEEEDPTGIDGKDLELLFADDAGEDADTG